jgi:hypothetical protein
VTLNKDRNLSCSRCSQCTDNQVSAKGTVLGRQFLSPIPQSVSGTRGCVARKMSSLYQEKAPSLNYLRPSPFLASVPTAEPTELLMA